MFVWGLIVNSCRNVINVLNKQTSLDILLQPRVAPSLGASLKSASRIPRTEARVNHLRVKLASSDRISIFGTAERHSWLLLARPRNRNQCVGSEYTESLLLLTWTTCTGSILKPAKFAVLPFYPQGSFVFYASWVVVALFVVLLAKPFLFFLRLVWSRRIENGRGSLEVSQLERSKMKGAKSTNTSRTWSCRGWTQDLKELEADVPSAAQCTASRDDAQWVSSPGSRGSKKERLARSEPLSFS